MRTIKCKNCGKEFEVPEKRLKITKNICCSNKCRYEFIKKGNIYNIKDDYCEMILKDKIIKIDIEDIDKLKPFTWYINSAGYVNTSLHIGRKNKRGIYKNILLHRFIMGVEKEIYPVVDHINRDKLDNRKSNLRLVNYQINAINASLRKDNKTGYKCVFFNKRTGKYFSQIRRNGKTKYLGSANTAEQAKHLYDKWVLEEQENDD